MLKLTETQLGLAANYATARVEWFRSGTRAYCSITDGRARTGIADLVHGDPHFGVTPNLHDEAVAKCSSRLSGPPPLEVPDPTGHAACFRGLLGEAYLALAGAKKDVDLAIMEWKDKEGQYSIAAQRCDELKDWHVELEQLESSRRHWKQAMSDARWFAVTATQMIGMGVAGAGGTGDAAAGSAEAGVGGISPAGAVGDYFDDAIVRAESSYQDHLRLLRAERELFECYADAKIVKLGIDNAMQVVSRKILEADRQIVDLATMKRSLRNTIAEGTAALVREDDRAVPPIAFHYWLDEKVDRFHKDFAWARSLVYLAVLAIEFEYQQSLSLHDEVLKATHPDQLLDAIQVLEQTQLSRTINGRRPEEDTIVRSLASDILDLSDLQPQRAGERRWTRLERFQNRLWSSEYAAFDDDGKYLGQGIPFSMSPEDELEYTCGEKVWRVTATLQGDTLSETEPNIPMLLMKRNYFGSQWCDGKGDGSPMQTASVQPASQLFHPDDRGGDEAIANQYVTAHLRPWFNVPRSELYREAYTEGASFELAGRGLYGEYILLFPAAGLLRRDFPLEKVEDVLLRFDILAVDDIALGGTLAADGVVE